MGSAEKIFVGRLDSYPVVVGQLRDSAVLEEKAPSTDFVAVADGGNGIKVGKQLSAKIAEILGGKSPADIPSEILPFEMQTILANATTIETLQAQLPYEIVGQAKIIE